VAVAPDGRLWIGDAGGDTEYSQPGGLYLLDTFAAPARQLARWPVRCLGYRALDGVLLGCTRSEFGQVQPDTGAFTALSAFQTVDAFVRCAGEDLASACQRQLCDNWCGVLHYAQAPLCDAYHEVSPVCGPAARGYGGEPELTEPTSLPASETAGTAPADAASRDAAVSPHARAPAGRCSLVTLPGVRLEAPLASALLASAAVAGGLRRRRRAPASRLSSGSRTRCCNARRLPRHPRR
jgi:hypothetical protein